jgi:hypothetical protein
MHYLFVLRRDQAPTQEMMEHILNGYRENFGNAQMLGGMKHSGPLPTEPDTYVVTICLAETKGLGFDSSRDEISYNTAMVFGEPVGVCRIEIKTAAQPSRPAPAPPPRSAEAPQAPFRPAPAAVPPPVEAPQAKIGAFGRIIGVFFSPGETFEDIARVSSWIAPLIVLTLTGLLISFALARRVDWSEYTRKQIERIPSAAARLDQLPPERRALAMESSARRQPIQRYVRGAIGSLCLILIMGGIYLGAFKLTGAGGALNYKTARAIVAHGYLPLAVRELIGVPVVFLKDPAAIDPDNFVASNLAAFLPSDAPLWYLPPAAWLDLFGLTCLVLIAIGFWKANPRKLTFGKSMVVVLSLSLIVIMFFTGLAYIFT